MPAVRIVLALLLALASLPAAAGDALDRTPAKILFGAAREPAPLEARSIGSYAKGCMAGAVALPVDGPYWQAMRLSRNRNWGTPLLVDFLEKLAADGAKKDGWPGLLVGDMAQPRGGPMLTGHASHQIGLDADIWLTPMPDRRLSAQEREDLSAVSMVDARRRRVDPSVWTPARTRIIRRAALDPRVSRIFVNPAIKKQLCAEAGADRAWLSKVRPWWGHDFHFHVRLDCPRGWAGCVPQKPPEKGDGCGAELDSWLAPPRPPKPGTKPPVVRPPRPVTLADLPAACRTVLLAGEAGATAPGPGEPPVEAGAAGPLPRRKPVD